MFACIKGKIWMRETQLEVYFQHEVKDVLAQSTREHQIMVKLSHTTVTVSSSFFSAASLSTAMLWIICLCVSLSLASQQLRACPPSLHPWTSATWQLHIQHSLFSISTIVPYSHLRLPSLTLSPRFLVLHSSPKSKDFTVMSATKNRSLCRFMCFLPKIPTCDFSLIWF